uniref:Transposase (putative) gypsy type domain-containing protein n=1 Tax=Oryza sativa subsp. japonica TaxID=39947 RepID=Q94LD1_ORYSJ|nr:hypothetical protein [Oryza sativa Japonica Group]
MAGLIPPFSRFLHEVLDLYEIHALHLAPNAVMTLAIFAHLCEMFIGVRPTMRLFQAFFIPQLLQGAVGGGCYFQPRPGTAGQGLWSLGLMGAMVFGDYFRRHIAPLQERSRGVWEYTGPNDPMWTHVGEPWDWGEEDAKRVIRWVLGLDSAEPTLIPDGILPLCCDRDRESILAVMLAVGAGRSRSSRGGASGSAVGGGGGGATAGGSRAGGPGGGGSRAPGSSRGPGGDSAGDPKGKRKVTYSRPPSPPRVGGAERATDRSLVGHKRPAEPETRRKRKRLRKIGQTEPCRGSFIEPPKWTFNRPPRSQSKAAGFSQPRGGAQRSHTGPDPERPLGGIRPTAGDRSGDARLEGSSRTRAHAEHHPGSGGEGRRGPGAEARGGPEPEAKAEAEGGPEPEAEVEAEAGPEPEVEAEAEGGPEPEVEAEAESTRGPEVGAEIQAREEALDSVMRETEEELQAALIASSALDEALGDIRLQYEAHVEDLAKRVRDARGILDAAAAHERRASEANASLRARMTALEAERKALDDRARSAQEFEATIRRRIEVLDRNQREQNARSEEQARRAQELEERARLLDQRESTLATHERTAAEVEASLRLREEAAAERDRITARKSYGCGKRHAGNGMLHLPSAKPRWAAASTRAERAAIAVKASELEAREKDLTVSGPSGGAELASQLATARSTLADLERLVQDEDGEIAALRLTNKLGPGQLSNAVNRLERAGRRVGISARRDSKLPPTQPALALRLDGLAADLERLEEEVGKTIKCSSASLARAAVELVLTSHQARDPDFEPWRALEDFPPWTEARARVQVREAADAIVSSFEGSAPRFTSGLTSDEESGSGGDDGDDDWDDIVSGAGLGGPGTP